MVKRRMRRLAIVLALTAAPVLVATGSSAGERCGCHHRLVLNGTLSTGDFDGGVGDRFGGDGYMSGATIMYGGASAGGFANGSASAAAHASAQAFVSISTSFHGGGVGHGGMGHGGGMHGGYGGGHH